MDPIFKYDTGTFFMAIYQEEDRIKKIRAYGTASEKDVLAMLEAIRTEVRKNEYCHLVINTDGLISFPWSLRKTIYQEATSWFLDHRVQHLHLVAPTPFVKMVGFLVSKFYRSISHTYYLTEEEGFKEARKQLFMDNNSFTEQVVENVIKDRVNTKHVYISKEIRLSDHTEMLLINENQLVVLVGKLISGQELIRLESELEKLNKSGTAIHLFIDFSQLEIIPKIEDIKASDLDSLLLKCQHTSIKLPATIENITSPWLESGSNSNKRWSIVESLSKALFNSILKPSTDQDHFSYKLPVDIDEQFLAKMTHEELLDYLNDFRQQTDQTHLYYKKQFNILSNVLSKITWNSDFESHQLEIPDETDVFYDIFQTVTILQKDMKQIGEQIRNTSSQMEAIVAERTQSIKKTESNLRALLDNYQNPIFLLDENFQVIDSNYSFQKFIQIAYDVDIEVGDYFFEPFDKNLVKIWRARFERCVLGEKQDYTESYLIDGKQYYFDIRLFPIRHEMNISGIGVFANNVTDLNTSKLTLEDQNISLLKLNNELDSFIYRSSHDLRAPVSSLLGLINLARMVEDPDEKDRCLSLMETSVNKMENFIKDIIDHTKNSKLDLEPEIIDLDEFLKDITGEFEHLDPTHLVKFTLSHSGNNHFVSDRYRLITILNNIISNAIKYKDQVREPEVNLSVNVDHNRAEFIISDNGQGIEKEYLPKIFDMFFRANEQSNGTGLGLYIVKDIVDKMNGTIELNSKLDVGTKVIITIPELEMEEAEIDS